MIVPTAGVVKEMVNTLAFSRAARAGWSTGPRRFPINMVGWY